MFFSLRCFFVLTRVSDKMKQGNIMRLGDLIDFVSSLLFLLGLLKGFGIHYCRGKQEELGISVISEGFLVFYMLLVRALHEIM